MVHLISTEHWPRKIDTETRCNTHTHTHKVLVNERTNIFAIWKSLEERNRDYIYEQGQKSCMQAKTSTYQVTLFDDSLNSAANGGKMRRIVLHYNATVVVG